MIHNPLRQTITTVRHKSLKRLLPLPSSCHTKLLSSSLAPPTHLHNLTTPNKTTSTSTAEDEQDTPPPSSSSSKQKPSPLPLSSKTATTPDPTRAIFPWRHSPLPLSRLTPGTEKYDTIGTMGPGMPPIEGLQRMVMYATAAGELGAPLYQILFFRKWWEEELCENFAGAFGRSVAAVVSDTFEADSGRVETKGDDDDDDGFGGVAVDFDFSYVPPGEERVDSSSSSGDKKGVNDDNDNDNSNKTPSSNDSSTKQHRPPPPNPVAAMLDSKLHNLYKNARQHHKSSSSFQIHLQTAPVSATLESLFYIPILTRDHVRGDPSLRHSFRNILYELLSRRKNENLNWGQVGSVALGLMEDLESKVGRADCGTVIAQTSVTCREVFWVRDAATGEVLQGCGGGEEEEGAGGREVTHLVRFEMAVRAGEGGKWVITDWDDLLDGNVFF